MEHHGDPAAVHGASAGADAPDVQFAAGETENVHIRNYDHEWGYDIEVTVLASDGTAEFTRRYYVQPGQTVSEFDRIPNGEYELQVTLDNDRHQRRQCRIDAEPEHTAVIEVGNGVFALSEGLRL